MLDQKINDIDMYAQFAIGMALGAEDDYEESEHSTPNEFQQAVNMAQVWSDTELVTMGEALNALAYGIANEKNMNRKKQFMDASRTFIFYSVECYEDSCGIAHFVRDE